MARDVRLDFWRGAALVTMLITHWPSEVRRFTFEGLGYVSAAEGFFLIAGLTAGVTASMATWPRALRRAGRLYLYHLGLCLIIGVCVWGSMQLGRSVPEWMARAGLFAERPLLALGLSVSLLYQPELLDVLPAYVLFTLLAPLVLRSLRQGRYALVLSGSFSLWVLSQLGLQAAVVGLLRPALPVQPGLFDPLGGQFVYVLGLCWGHYRQQKGHWMPRPTPLFLGLGGVAVVLCLLVRYRVLPPGAPLLYTSPLVSRTTFGPWRLINLAALTYLATALSEVWPAPFGWRVMAYLGQHSLLVFSYHVLLVYASMLLWQRLDAAGSLVQTGSTLAAVLSLYAPAWLDACWRTRKKRRVAYAQQG